MGFQRHFIFDFDFILFYYILLCQKNQEIGGTSWGCGKYDVFFENHSLVLSNKHFHKLVYQYICKNIDTSFSFLIISVNSISFAIMHNKLINLKKRFTAGIIIEFCKYFEISFRMF